MSNSMSLPLEKCMKCGEECDILLSSLAAFFEITDLCDHKFCKSCFRKENTDLATSETYTFRCPCCHTSYYEDMLSIEVVILLGEAATITIHIEPQLSLPVAETSEERTLIVFNMNKLLIEKLEAAIKLDPANLNSMCLLFRCCQEGRQFYVDHKCFISEEGARSAHYCQVTTGFWNFYESNIYQYACKMLDHPAISEQNREYLKSACWHELAVIFNVNHNYPAALKYSKLAYECLLRVDHNNLSYAKALYDESCADFAELPPLRFAVGDEVEFLHKLDTENEWKLGEIVELYYREWDFELSFTAPYRLQLLEGDESDPVYAWVKGDIDRYIRKVGVSSIEDTRFQAQLDAKVEELAQVYYSKEFIRGVYRTLAHDREFVDMIQSVWGIELSVHVLSVYHINVTYREPLVRTDSGYHIPTADEVIAGIRAFFDPTHLSDHVAPSAADKDRDSQWIRADVLRILRGDCPTSIRCDDAFIHGRLLRSITNHIVALYPLDSFSPTTSTTNGDHAPTSAASNVQEKAPTVYERLTSALSDPVCLSRSGHQEVWNGLERCLTNPNTTPALECPFIYVFVKYCLNHDVVVPQVAIAVYDRMNMQLSREFIRCANPTCELNRLDQSTGKVKFKKCSRCLAVIYCSRECQVAHYPLHKKLCRAPSKA